MQHKQRALPPGALIAALAVLIIGGIAVLMTRHVPAHPHVIEKQLDAKAFLDQKQP